MPLPLRLAHTLPQSYSDSLIRKHIQSDSLALRLSHNQTRSYIDTLAHKLTRSHTITIRVPSTQTHSYPYSLILRQTHMQSYPRSALFILSPDHIQTHTPTHTRFTHSRIYSHSDALIHRLTRIQTHSLELNHTQTPSHSDSVTPRFTRTHVCSDRLIRSAILTLAYSHSASLIVILTHPDSLILRHARTQTRPCTDSLALRLIRSQQHNQTPSRSRRHTQSDSLTLRLSHTQTRSYTNSLARTQSQSDFPAPRLSHSQTHPRSDILGQIHT